MTDMIRIQGLKKSFGAKQQQRLPIVHIEQWAVKKGERIALLGQSGSGKSTLLHLIGGVLAPDQGRLVAADQLVSAMSERARDAYRAEYVGYVFQDFYLIPSLTIRQNVELVLPRAASRKERNRLLEEWFERVGLADRMNHLPSKLSRGQQQRAAIVRALACRPPIVLADEPTGSLDVETADSVMRLLLDICKENGSTLLAVTHDLQLAKLFPMTVQMNEINECLRYSGRSGDSYREGMKEAAEG
ncbi:ABC transporter ATP-binding protein [Paenibacillus sp. LHD-117]|uniref:ABC transporter ATP-binding protein n=1 Tax=Paenibacillus sp. LHD-117 TaxID=3071412 RepID=UPI0027E0A499|nr:ABC transporter ATP-binding protein [Paenibacillus sp. LHD-117]MDQ6419455.1 ABC transporter ATP-binding protein [Paenibacillus sp. LHD-117]